jgi:hypothetical protein
MGFSASYEVDLTEKKASQDIPDDHDTNFFIKGLAADVTHGQIMVGIRNYGRIYACVINPPQDDHETSAAKIEFFDLAGAQRFWAQLRGKTVIIRGKSVTNFAHNCNKRGERRTLFLAPRVLFASLVRTICTESRSSI